MANLSEEVLANMESVPGTHKFSKSSVLELIEEIRRLRQDNRASMVKLEAAAICQREAEKHLGWFRYQEAQPWVEAAKSIGAIEV
jgi:hypothetical protein